MKEETELYSWDSATAAFHELGHAIIQIAFDIGPADLGIRSVEGGWKGYSHLFAHVDPDEAFEFHDVSRLGGPIAQLLYRPESLREFWEVLAQSILRNHGLLLAADSKFLRLVGWYDDLSGASKILERAKYGLSEKQDQSFQSLETKNYLFASERALRAFFRNSRVQDFMMVMANKLAHDRQLDAGSIRDKAHSLIPSESIKILTSIEFPRNVSSQ